MARTASLDPGGADLSEIIGDVRSDTFGLRMTFSDAIAKEKWGRSFFLNERLQLRQAGEEARFFLFLSPHGWGFWRDLLSSHNSASYLWNDGQAAFRWSQENERGWLYEASAAQILARVMVLLSDGNSDIAFAQRVCSSSFDQRRQTIWPCKQGNTADIERVLCWALLAQDKLWSSATSLRWNVNLHVDNHDDSFLEVDYEEYLPPALKKALLQVLAFFAPKYDEEAVKHNLCLKIAAYGSSRLAIEANTPSIHERLEAKLEWRDWLATNYPDQP